MSRQDAYLGQLQSLLPTGAAWPREEDAVLTHILRVIAYELAQVEARADHLIEESDPRTTTEMLSAWEAEMGLPDTCSSLAITLVERYAALLQKITNTGGQSIAFFTDIAARLGYENIVIREYRPSICGVSRCGETLDGGHAVRFYWRVDIPSPRLSFARTGVSQAGDVMMSISRAVDLECVFTRLKPAHTTLIFSYEGV